MLAVLSITCFLVAGTVSGQERLVYKQEVVVTHKNNDYCFYRYSYDCKNWGDWVNKPPWNMLKYTYQIYKPQPVNQKIVSTMLGSVILDWLQNRPKVSGYYNFTTNPAYDWKNYGGDNYGTYSKKYFISTYTVY